MLKLIPELIIRVMVKGNNHDWSALNQNKFVCENFSHGFSRIGETQGSPLPSERRLEMRIGRDVALPSLPDPRLCFIF